ncbi:hypothetical protein [Lacrimispora saccharolytica]|uniref:hypothetical protein n=1 Tax=Lacrimispora saccharolytica TaxID=84030 RepID=UPI00265C9095|nr:hypothetical protein [Lacrimispora saccharolytica]MCF2657530.1 hypothetical protein [Lacrimispora saccharolytica]
MKRRLIRFLMISMTTLMLCGCGKQYTTEISLDEIVESKDRNETNFDEKDDVEEISIGSSDNEVVADLKHADESSDENSENQNVDGSSEMVDDAFRLVIAELQRALNSDDEAMLTSLGFDIEIKWANSLGYAEYDYDGDGINELIIGEDEGTRTFVWAVYEKYQTGDGWNTTVAVSGYARNRYYLMDGNRLLNEWSAGAADCGTDIYKLDSAGGKFLESSVYDDYSSQCIKLTLQPIY